MARVLVVGSGGREHALAWKLSRDAAGPQIYAAPGNPGSAQHATCLPISPGDLQQLADAAVQLGVDLTVVGPETPLAAGIVDLFRARGLRIFGPTQAAAELEASKVFAKTFLLRYGLPTADFAVFADPSQAVEFVRRRGRPVVIKADGLASGKGVVVAETQEAAERAIDDLMVTRVHGSAGARVVIEDRLEGEEVSVLALVGPGGVTPLLPARDYKRVHDGDRGPNTGGMGAVAPAGASPQAVAHIVDTILEPAVAAMVREGRPYTGVLYAGVMITADGPQVLEFNCRFGDPEAQVVLPLLAGDLAPALIDVLEGRPAQLHWDAAAAACVVLAGRGYPGASERGMPVRGLEDVPEGVRIFHAGTALQAGRLVTAGGRVLNVVATGPTLPQAVARAYDAVRAIRFEGMQFRTDIGREPARWAPVGRPLAAGGVPS